ncbi:MAG TPA: hypothetical protein VL576_03225 [Candidatus Paceibacterota bacterium]|jgi:hypothetical protein|nr:hypothetical protein [Candidatus Paceibacterota bacterium]
MIQLKIKDQETTLQEGDTIRIQMNLTTRKATITFWRKTIKLLYAKEALKDYFEEFLKDFRRVKNINAFQRKVLRFKKIIDAFSDLDLEIPETHGLEMYRENRPRATLTVHKK